MEAMEQRLMEEAASERAPLLRYPNGSMMGTTSELGDLHAQFCHLIGVKSVNHPSDEPFRPPSYSLYARALKQRKAQNCTYVFTATLVNTLLLGQIVLGAALTGLGASNSSHILITVFGAANTIIAGLIAFLKSRGQPLRARMFRDDLARVVDEIENSAVMWYGISSVAHGYDAIDTDEQVTIRSEVARLTRLYDKAVKTNTMNDPDMYSAGTGDSYAAGLRKNYSAVPPPPPADSVPSAAPPAKVPEPAALIPSTQAPPPPPPAQAQQPVPAADPEDESPASKAPDSAPPPVSPSPPEKTPAEDDPPVADVLPASGSSSSKGKEDVSSPRPTSPQPVQSTPPLSHDPDESPATAARPPKKEDSSKSERTLV
ncbi:hypothetical protein NLU13_0829 [Sarocladium strictum]|uniref:SMODS and SLOG-associating 2TM effector domain-containing protein n=1 Tax=Sarocladium strictum TaxID=5046 RepID=A0AA39GPS9_SARSR|nr:hypothetical protein NLU13_0829 [Sarocladium strictum]